MGEAIADSIHRLAWLAPVVQPLNFTSLTVWTLRPSTSRTFLGFVERLARFVMRAMRVVAEDGLHLFQIQRRASMVDKLLIHFMVVVPK